MKNIEDALALAQSQIERLDAQYLLAKLTGLSRASLVAHPERELSAADALSFEQQISARAKGIPVAQIIGSREFYGRDFAINEHVLIPRPETEILVDQALAALSSQKWLEVQSAPCVLDLGTGCGTIALTLALELPNATVTAVDKSSQALQLAAENARALGAKITIIESDWYDDLNGEKFDLIVANPPYIARNDPHLSQGDLRFEPHMALTDDSDDGLASIRAIVAGAGTHLNDGGWLLFEHGYDQAAKCRALMEQSHFTGVQSVPDLAGIPRVALGQYHRPPAV